MLFESAAYVSPNGFIQFAGQSRVNEREPFNLCEILLEWSTPEQFGIQRIRLGHHKPLTREQWRRKLQSRAPKNRTLYSAAICSRKLELQACFPRERIKFDVLGWRLMSVKFWVQGSAVRIDEASEAKISKVRVKCLDASMSRRGAKLQ
jgi:hypothetical protein